MVIHGWMNPEELAELQELAIGRWPVLEVGCFHGLATAALAAAAFADVTVIDTFAGSPEMPEGQRRDILPQFAANMQAAGVMERVTIRIGRSQDIMPRLPHASFGLVFIDGSHEFRDVLSDMQCARMLLKPGGLIVFDDRQWPGVAEAANIALPGWTNSAGKMGIWRQPE